MPTKPQCDSCRWFRAIADQAVIGHCAFHPPGQRYPKITDGANDIQFLQTRTRIDWDCSNWERTSDIARQELAAEIGARLALRTPDEIKEETPARTNSACARCDAPLYAGTDVEINAEGNLCCAGCA